MKCSPGVVVKCFLLENWQQHQPELSLLRALSLKHGGELEERRNSCLSAARAGNALAHGLSCGAKGGIVLLGGRL